MKLTGPLLVVADIRRSTKFYREVLGDEVVMDLGGNLTFKSGLILQDQKYWVKLLRKKDAGWVRMGGNNFELYFEDDHFDAFLEHLKGFPDTAFAHPLEEYPWGQRSIHLYDPDRHIVEVAESMCSVICGCVAEGMSPEEAARRTQHPLDYVLHCLRDEGAEGDQPLLSGKATNEARAAARGASPEGNCQTTNQGIRLLSGSPYKIKCSPPFVPQHF